MKFSASLFLSALSAAMVATPGKSTGIPPEVFDKLPEHVQAKLAESPAVQRNVCDQYDGQAGGLCYAYYKKECDTTDTPSCTSLANNFLRITGDTIPMLAPCPIAFGIDFTAIENAFISGIFQDGALIAVGDFGASGGALVVGQFSSATYLALLSSGFFVLESRDEFESCFKELATVYRNLIDDYAIGDITETSVCPCWDSDSFASDFQLFPGKDFGFGIANPLFLQEGINADNVYTAGPTSCELEVSDVSAENTGEGADDYAKCEESLIMKQTQLLDEVLATL